MRFQQIAKELHIELVVLHDQDGFCHPVPPIPVQALNRNGERNMPKRRKARSQVKYRLAPDSLKAVKTKRLLYANRFALA
jgi:hypothetical protein